MLFRSDQAIDETNTIGTGKMNRITRDEYIEIVKGFMQSKFNDRDAQLNFALAVVGEAIKFGTSEHENLEDARLGLGDLQWYLTALCLSLHVNPDRSFRSIEKPDSNKMEVIDMVTYAGLISEGIKTLHFHNKPLNDDFYQAIDNLANQIHHAAAALKCDTIEIVALNAEKLIRRHEGITFKPHEN